ncbi:hypothetical protein LZ30DRAFT_292684 [Colletotrichum cereale]|nr:hypothetical protein LZ30DRAFT_292684 [Colletotrichum cereale]
MSGCQGQSLQPQNQDSLLVNGKRFTKHSSLCHDIRDPVPTKHANRQSPHLRVPSSAKGCMVEWHDIMELQRRESYPQYSYSTLYLPVAVYLPIYLYSTLQSSVAFSRSVIRHLFACRHALSCGLAEPTRLLRPAHGRLQRNATPDGTAEPLEKPRGSSTKIQMTS